NYDGNTGQTRQTWSLAHVPGPRYLDKPVWVLVGGGTFSGGEEFAYNLQALGRATIVGATTLGGAHVFEYFPLSPTMEFIIPFERAVNPVTGTNWEGTGVEPDVAVSQDEAFDTAYRAALEHVSGLETHPSIHTEAAEALAGLKRPAEDLTSMRNDIDNLLAEDTDNL
ncbi:MAG: S41 family peptidase, partial [Stackebrandtia sp.]